MSTHAVMYVCSVCMALAAWEKCEFTQVFLNHLHASSWLSLYNVLPMITELLDMCVRISSNAPFSHGDCMVQGCVINTCV